MNTEGFKRFLSWGFGGILGAVLLTVVLSLAGGGDNPPSPPPSAIATDGGQETASPLPPTPSPDPPLESWVGSLIDPVTDQLEALGVTVTIKPVEDATRQEGVIIAQNPQPPGPLPDEIEFTVVRNPERFNLMSCCLHVVEDACFRWERMPAVLGRRTYQPGLVLNYDICGVDRHTLSVQLPTDPRITRLKAVVGVAGNSDATSRQVAIAVISVDGKRRPGQSFSVVRPLHIDLDVARASRVEIVIKSVDDDLPVAVGGVFGFGFGN